MVEEVRVGVIGTGGMGGRHAANLSARVAGARLSAVMDADLARAEQAAARAGARVYHDARALIDDAEVEAVIVASPDATHAELALACLEVGKPVLCEKPLATTVESAWAVVERETALGRRLVQVGFMRQYDPPHAAVRKAAETGAIGTAKLFKGWHRNTRAPRGLTSEQVILSSAVHDLHSARWLLGQEIEEVFVSGANTDPALGADVWDLQLIQLWMTGGCLGMIELYVNDGYGYEVGAEVVGTLGTAQTLPMSGATVRCDHRFSQEIELDWLARFELAYLNEVQEWIDQVRVGAEPAGPDAWDGYASNVAADACIRSIHSGCVEQVRYAPRPSLYIR
jgi:myo-inositol 2-dehydrogenase/D-chiro-inositol 1-dehydrogenase